MGLRLTAWFCLAATLGGCSWQELAPWAGAPLPVDAAPVAVVANPLFVPTTDRELVWNQVVDAVDDHFKIEREQRVQAIGGVLTQGRIDTFPTVGATLLEPWRGDSTPGFERLHATLQSIRRWAVVHVIPSEGGFLISVTVEKELEDLDRPEQATTGNATLRHDGSLVRQRAPKKYGPYTLGWIPQGRDVSLEQKILADIGARLYNVGPPTRLPPL